jgi:hypothetical protein
VQDKSHTGRKMIDLVDVLCMYFIIFFMYLKLLQNFSKTVSENLSARKYMRSLSETALFYRPSEVRMLPEEENMRDRVVQTFFTASTSKIQVFEASNRLS